VKNPVAFDLCCGKGGWTVGLQAAGFHVIGFDLERYPDYPGELVIQDILTLHGSQLRNAVCIVASPPCQEPSYRAMPWKRARKLNEEGPPHRFIALFDACFRIQREASEAAGHHIPMVVENVRGAQKWVGPAKWHFGSYYLWGDVPALMPPAFLARKNNGGNWFAVAPGTSGRSRNPVNNFQEHGVKLRAPGHYQKPGSGPDWFDYGPAAFGSGSAARKAASAQISMIPFPLARWIAEVYAA
jgi:hypothetical protein